ncbi:hypothetical protein Nepgr_031079 [Nepenthes gracilis]|uniref:Probable purine permease n=1 Tax=Nepenthes gracilis TaxID=150966 RepID=A0AAD3Y776_NEPGR|nr:hypothetical protein Nepgr_031079 [Nepenthes gracilis]
MTNYCYNSTNKFHSSWLTSNLAHSQPQGHGVLRAHCFLPALCTGSFDSVKLGMHLFSSSSPSQFQGVSMEAEQEALPKSNEFATVSMPDDRVRTPQSRSSDIIRRQIHSLKTLAWEEYKVKPISYWILLIPSIGAMLVAFPASSLLTRIYYTNGGQSKWIISWVAVAGWPLTALVLLPVYFFSAMAMIALDSSSDRYGDISRSKYIAGFIWDILGSALHGLIFALSELVFVKFLGRVSFHVVLEQQVMVLLFAFVFTTVGVVMDRGFQRMASEVRGFKGGKSSYCMVLVWGAVTFQLGVLGGTAVLYLASTVLAGVLNAIRVPITSVAAVILLHDPMSGFKILSLIISFWGFISYVYGSSSRSAASSK